MNLVTFAESVVAYRRAFDGSVTSWGRSHAHNLAVGGHANSRHMIDLAADVVPGPGFCPAKRVARGAELGLWVLIESDHDHLEPLDLHP